MHTIRVKEKVGRSWTTKKKLAIPDTIIAANLFQNYIGEWSVNEMPNIPYSITWSEGKKVHGTFRIN